MDVLVLGELNPDLIVTGLSSAPCFDDVERLAEAATCTIGGSSAIFACGTSRLGLSTSIIGIVGSDPFGRFMVQSLTDRAVDCTHCVVHPTQPTGATVILTSTGRDVASRRAIITALGTIASLTAEHLPPSVLAMARHVHVGSYYLQRGLQQDLPQLLRTARARGATTSVDANYDPAEDWTGLLTQLEDIDVLFVNATEARALTNKADLVEAARSLAVVSPPSGTCRTVVVKDGAAGALAVRGTGQVTVTAPEFDVVDTIGAGDSLAAGVVYGLLAGWSLERTVRLGVTCGSLSTRACGGTAAQPDLREALAHCPREDS